MTTSIKFSKHELESMSSNWTRHYAIAYEAFETLDLANNEITEYLLHTPLSNPSLTRYKGMRNVNSMMSIYFNSLPAYLQQIEKGTIISPVDDYTLGELKIIATQSLLWRDCYNDAVSKYKKLQKIYHLTSHNNDATDYFTQ